jgi:hypothetical protein
MRTLRSSLVGIAVAALLSSLTASAVLAQDWASGDPADFVFVEGEEINGACDGFECVATHVMSDPRVSGDLDIQLDLGCSTEIICSMGGELTISNDDGTWDGHYVGFINDAAPGGRTHDQMMWLEGSGAYEGWSYVAVLTDLYGIRGGPDTPEGLHPGTTVRGVFYRGDLPPSVADTLLPPVPEPVASE